MLVYKFLFHSTLICAFAMTQNKFHLSTKRVNKELHAIKKTQDNLLTEVVQENLT